MNLNYASMSPVNFCQPNAKGFNDVFGNAWEWTMDYFCALPGFQVHPYYEDFSTPCFDGLHNVIQGGSFISSGNEASFHSRFHFRPHFFQHASFRLVENLSPGDVLTSDVDAPGPYVGDYPFRRSSTSLKAESVKSNMDAIQRKRNLVKSMHYGSLPDVDSELKQTSSIKAFSSFVLNASEKLRIDANAKVLEVGCGPGGLSFQLAKRFPLVMAVDHDSYLIEEANRLKQGMPVHYTLASNGGEAERIPITAEPVKHRIDFRCADPMCLPAEMSDFDIVSLNDVIDKISSPSALLSRLAGVRGLVKPGGLLTIWSKFQWNEDRTPKPLWIGQGHIPPVDDLLNRLSEDFALVDSQDLTVLWRESKKDLRGGIYSAIALQRK